MRISKFTLPVLTVAGALALAGCGGGSDMSGEGDGDEENVRSPAAGSGGYTRVTIPGGFTLDDENENDAGTIRTTDVAYFGAEGTGVEVTCTDADGCAWEVRNGILMARGTFTAKLWEKPAVPAPAGNTAQPTNTSDPLSSAVLLEALKANGTSGKVATPWTTNTQGLADVDGGAPLSYTYPGTNPKRQIKLTVQANGEAIYWGHWHRYTEGAVDPEDSKQYTDEARGVVFGGAKRYDAKPDADAGGGEAEYQGTAHLFYKSGKNGDWKPGERAASLTLNADFGSGMIGGKVTGVAGTTGAAITTGPGGITVPTGADYSEIVLGNTAIGSDGAFNGTTATFKKGNNQSGDWEGAFYNPATGAARAVNKDNRPGFVAGEFSVTNSTRAAQNPEDVTAQNTAPPGHTHDLTVHGAFGSTSVSR